MARKDWLALVAVHSDAWLMAVAFFYAVKLDREGRWAAVRHVIGSSSSSGSSRGRSAKGITEDCLKAMAV
jgi:hypothetical protein